MSTSNTPVHPDESYPKADPLSVALVDLDKEALEDIHMSNRKDGVRKYVWHLNHNEHPVAPVDAAACPLPLHVIPNYMGINLVSVESLRWSRLPDGQLIDLTLAFLPVGGHDDNTTTDCETTSDLPLVCGSVGIPGTSVVTPFDVETRAPLNVEFQALAKPLIKWLNENYDPHRTIIITPTSAELCQGCMAFQTEEFLRD